MTNEQIILAESLELMKQGIIGTTGQRIIIENEDGSKLEINEPEPIHTFGAWKNTYHRTVKKGEKAIASFDIWKHSVKKAKQEDEEDSERMFLTKAFWFKYSQTEPVTEN